MLSLRPRLAVLGAGVLLASGCAGAGTDAGPGDASPATSSTSPSRSAGSATPTPAPSEATEDPDTPTSWGPTIGELDEARELVSTWSPAQLAGGVIVGRFHGTDPAGPAAMVRDLHLAGVSVTGDNVDTSSTTT